MEEGCKNGWANHSSAKPPILYLSPSIAASLASMIWVLVFANSRSQHYRQNNSFLKKIEQVRGLAEIISEDQMASAPIIWSQLWRNIVVWRKVAFRKKIKEGDQKWPLKSKQKTLRTFFKRQRQMQNPPTNLIRLIRKSQKGILCKNFKKFPQQEAVKRVRRQQIISKSKSSL